jgi:hypothetical protein
MTLQTLLSVFLLYHQYMGFSGDVCQRRARAKIKSKHGLITVPAILGPGLMTVDPGFPRTGFCPKMNGDLDTDFLAEGKITDFFMAAALPPDFFQYRVTVTKGFGRPGKRKGFNRNRYVNLCPLKGMPGADFICVVRICRVESEIAPVFPEQAPVIQAAVRL